MDKVGEARVSFSEDALHQCCVGWFYSQYGNTGAILHHSPNENPKGVRSTLIRYNAKMKALGRLAGFPDVLIAYKSRILFIEIKSSKGVVSAAQKELFKKLQSQGIKVFIVKSLEEFEEIVNQFILGSL